MSLIQKLAIVYALMFFAVVAIGYVPAFNDADGNLFGLFSLQWYDDLLHAFSGVGRSPPPSSRTARRCSISSCSARSICSTACSA